MKRTVKYMFRSHSVVTDISGNIPRWCRFRLPYAQAERIDVKKVQLSASITAISFSLLRYWKLIYIPICRQIT